MARAVRDKPPAKIAVTEPAKVPAKTTAPAKATAKVKKAKLDAAGLAQLGMDRLVALVLDEVGSNKALKTRLNSTLAALSSPQDAAVLIEKRLETVESGKTRIKSIKAKPVADDLNALLKSLLADVAAHDAALGHALLWRFLKTRARMEQRHTTHSPKLDAVYEEALAQMAGLIAKLEAAQQIAFIDELTTACIRDPGRGWDELALALVPSLTAAASDHWRTALKARLPTKETEKKDRNFGPVFLMPLLQALALQRGDMDDAIALERFKPPMRREPYRLAQLLFDAGRLKDALEWVRQRPSVTSSALSATLPVPPLDYVRLEARILEGLKDRPQAQTVRWAAFESTLDASILKDYIAKADDFAEFEELDKAFAFAMASDRLHDTLVLLMDWPKLTLASTHVLDHAGHWGNEAPQFLFDAAERLADDHPISATLLYRQLVDSVLQLSNWGGYALALEAYRAIGRLASRLPATLPFATHAKFLEQLESRYGKKYGFWNQLKG